MKNVRRFFGFILGGVLLLLASCTAPASPAPSAPVASSSSLSSIVTSSSSSEAQAQTLPHRTISLVGPDQSSVSIDAEIADDDAEREIGLMFRTSLGDDAGMLFVFNDAQPLSFWMKNTLIPLDILFFDAAGNLVTATTMQPCRADPCPGYPSNGPVQYALEVNAEYGGRHGIGGGWKMILP